MATLPWATGRGLTAMTFLLETLRLGLTNLLLHKMRSLLTAMGIIFGVAAVIAMVAIGEGNKLQSLEEIGQLGARNIVMRSIKPTQLPQQQGSKRGFMLQYGITREDATRIEQTVSNIEHLVPMKRVATRVSHVIHHVSAQVFGTTPQLMAVTRLQVARGRYLSDSDMHKSANVAVLGASVARRLFPLADPIDNWIRFQGQSYRVIGVLKSVSVVGGAGAQQLARDLDFDVHIPMTAARSRFGDQTRITQAGSFQAEKVEISQLFVAMVDEAHVLDAADQISLIIDREHTDKDDVKTIVPLALLQQQQRTLRMFNALMTAIAAISLLVGGIGIMNIMLASVTERTREIGIRRAVGATRRHIIAQFLTETTTLSSIGGALGVGVGLGAVFLLAWFKRTWPAAFTEMGVPIPTDWSIIAALTVAVLVGTVFGLYPAIKAAHQDPIESLRHE